MKIRLMGRIFTKLIVAFCIALRTRRKVHAVCDNILRLAAFDSKAMCVVNLGFTPLHHGSCRLPGPGLATIASKQGISQTETMKNGYPNTSQCLTRKFRVPMFRQ